mmetsp:Transcript_13521/g.14987  ORF Transcript_13521/g.14987 Transcript_13521/m.14987 type:complete len:203 (+) Transcript_13521:54-662(+)
MATIWPFNSLLILLGVLSLTQGLQICDTKTVVFCENGYCVVTSYENSKAVCAVSYCDEGDCCTLANDDRTHYTCDNGKCKETDSCVDHIWSWEFWLGGGFVLLIIITIIACCCYRKRRRERARRAALDQSQLVNPSNGVGVRNFPNQEMSAVQYPNQTMNTVQYPNPNINGVQYPNQNMNGGVQYPNPNTGTGQYSNQPNKV